MSAQTTRQSSRVLVAMTLCAAMQMTGFVMILPLFPRRFESFGAGVQALGVSAMAYALTSTFAAPFIGALADRFGRRPVILLSLTACVLIFGGYMSATSSWLLIVLRGLAGIFTAGLLPTLTSIVGDLAPENRRAQWIGILDGGASTGWILGPLSGGLLYDRYGFVVPFAASIMLAIVALLLAAFLIPETRTPSAHLDRPRLAWAQELRTLPDQPTMTLLLLITFCVAFAWAFIEPKFMFYAYDDLRWNSSKLGLVMSTFGLSFTFGAFTLGQLSDRLGRKPVLVLGLAHFSAQFAGLVLFRDLTWIVTSFILSGFGNALYDPALSALILDVTPTEQTAGMLGLKSMAGSLGNLVGPALLVPLTPFVGPQVVFLIAASLLLVLTVITLTHRLVPLHRGPALAGQRSTRSSC